MNKVTSLEIYNGEQLVNTITGDSLTLDFYKHYYNVKTGQCYADSKIVKLNQLNGYINAVITFKPVGLSTYTYKYNNIKAE